MSTASDYTYVVRAKSATSDGRAVRLGIEPGAVLARLVATLEGVPASQPADEVACQVTPGFWLVADDAVMALCGADGDPEMEWDDAVGQWAAHPDAAAALDGLSESDLLDLTDRLRTLCGEMAPDEQLWVVRENARPAGGE